MHEETARLNRWSRAREEGPTDGPRSPRII